MMNARKPPRKPFFLLIIVGFFLIAAAVVMLLWNNILPEVLGVKTINYRQALGLLVLCKILFGFGAGRWGPPFRKRNWKERLRNMSDEDKERLREEWRKRFHK